jgi:hypothetical protein
MKEVISGGYWQVGFQDNSRPMQTDERFESQFPGYQHQRAQASAEKGLLVDIPVGDFKISHLSEHPNLHAHAWRSQRLFFTNGWARPICF